MPGPQTKPMNKANCPASPKNRGRPAKTKPSNLQQREVSEEAGVTSQPRDSEALGQPLAPAAAAMAGLKRSADIAFGDDEIVRFLVGPERHKFCVHRSMLLRRIPHFQKTFGEGSKFREAATLETEQPDMDTSVMELVCKYIYTGHLPEIPAYPRGADVPPAQLEEYMRVERSYHGLVGKADFWLCGPLARAGVEQIRKFHSATATPIHLDIVLDGIVSLPTHSGLRDFLLAQLSFLCQEGDERITDVYQQMDRRMNDRTDGYLLEIIRLLSKAVVEKKGKMTLKLLLDPTRDWYATKTVYDGIGD